MGFHDGELSLLLTGDKHISELNRRYLGREGPTNVLAFPMEEGEAVRFPLILGDVVVSLETALAESRGVQEPFERTVYRLIIHGILHLLGYDHERSAADARRMKREEKRLLSLVEEE